MKLAFTRAIVDAIHAGQLQSAPTMTDPVFGLEVVTACPNVPSAVLNPRDTWSDPAAFDATARKLAELFSENYKQFEEGGTFKGTMDG
jgi:phosphoenolpyruvate carboxykinase (ATP)